MGTVGHGHLHECMFGLHAMAYMSAWLSACKAKMLTAYYVVYAVWESLLCIKVLHSVYLYAENFHLSGLRKPCRRNMCNGKCRLAMR